MQHKLILVYLILALCISTLKCYEQSPYMTYYPEDPDQDFPRDDTSCPVGKYPGLFWDGQKCDSCWSEQCYCKTYQGCDSCPNYYSKDNNGKCQECESIYIGQSQQALTCCFDSKCNYAYSAVTCDSGAYKYGGVCVELSNCGTYSLFGTCTKCLAGYYLDYDQTCQECEREHCIECYGPYLCKTCDAGYYLSVKEYTEDNVADSYKFGECISCPEENCTCSAPKVNSGPECSGCKSGLLGYYWDSNAKSCVDCATNCRICLNTTQCKTCLNEFYLDELGQCQPCSGNCFNCTYINQTEKCVSTTCYNGFYYNISTFSCEECPQMNAARCKGPEDADITQCVTGVDSLTQDTHFQPLWITHQDEYYLVEYTNASTRAKTKQCVLNEGNCKQIQGIYDNVTTDYTFCCLSCYTELDYVQLNNDKMCYKCNDITVGNEGCIKCHSGVANLTGLICDTCLSGEEIDDLLYAKQWWYTYESTFETFTNTRADFLDNYYLDKSDNSSLDAVTCTLCSDGCKTCTNSTKCTQCQKGYRLTTDSSCEECDDIQCSDCKVSKDQCVTCFAGYRKYLDSDNITYKCQPCSQYCLKCDSNQDVCTQCYSGYDNTFDYYLSNNQCVKKRQNCIMGSATGACALCAYGFRIVDGWCHQCGSVNSDGSNSIAYVNCYDYCSSKAFINDGGSSSPTSSGTNSNGTNTLNIGSPILSYTYAILVLVSLFILILA